MQTFKLDLEQLKPWAQEFSSKLSKKQIVLLSGSLGAGKTELVKLILGSMGCEEVHSPTYGLIHEYSLPQRNNVYHVDLYRLEGEEDLESSGFWDLFDNQEGLLFIEWADRINKKQWPIHWDQVAIEIEMLYESQYRLYKVDHLQKN